MDKKDDFNININLDTTPIYYTDNIFITINKHGLVLNITQQVGNTNQVRIVSRIGMSKDHAKKFIEVLCDLIIKNEGQGRTGNKIIN